MNMTKVEIPYIRGAFRHVLHPPGMRAAQAAGNPAQWYINDHCFLTHEGKIHWYGIVNPYPNDRHFYAPGTHRHVGHASAADPFGPWTEHPHAFAYPAGTTDSVGACFVVEQKDEFIMLCGANILGDGLNVATSRDLHAWSWDRSVAPIHPVHGTRDPCVIADPNGGYLLYVTGGESGIGQIYLASGRDPRHWTWEEPALVTDETVGPGCLESPFVHERNGVYYLFVNFSHRQYEETIVFASGNPRHFDWRSPLCTLFTHAAEIFSWKGKDYISHCGIEDQHWRDTGAPYGLWLAELAWLPARG
ncbi:MAG: hypothetical protein PHR35_06715 [Kiritimatiellae bacterium]|nr:hypothetical protein [Kiritimatiellia bacterium]